MLTHVANDRHYGVLIGQVNHVGCKKNFISLLLFFAFNLNSLSPIGFLICRVRNQNPIVQKMWSDSP
jgi:hypothetical protein